MNWFKCKSWIAIFMLVSILTTTSLMAADVKQMTKEELKKVMDTVTILDVRTGRDWSSSEFKIKGAVYFNPEKFNAQAIDYPKEETLVLYCA